MAAGGAGRYLRALHALNPACGVARPIGGAKEEALMGKTIAAVAIALSATVLSAESAEYADMKKFVRENSQLSPRGTASPVGPMSTTANSQAARNIRTQPLWGVRLRGRI